MQTKYISKLGSRMTRYQAHVMPQWVLRPLNNTPTEVTLHICCDSARHRLIFPPQFSQEESMTIGSRYPNAPSLDKDLLSHYVSIHS
jgi:hypothetical protein